MGSGSQLMSWGYLCVGLYRNGYEIGVKGFV